MAEANESTEFVAGMKRQVGWFVMLGVGALLLVLLIVSVRSNVFAKKFYLFVEPPSASSFYEGQPVKFQGFAIGHIDQIELQHEGQVRISLRLLERYRHMLHEGSVMHLAKEGLLGEQVVEVTTGDIKLPALLPDATLQYETEASIEQLLTELKPAVNHANVLLKEMAELAVWMNDPKGDLRLAMSGLRGVTQGVRGESLQAAVQEFTHALSELKQLTGDLNKEKVSQHLSDTLAQTSDILKNIEPLTASLGETGPDTMEHVNALLQHVDSLSEAMNLVASDLSEMTPELPGLAHEARATLSDMRGLLKNLQNSWLLGGGGAEHIEQGNLETAPPVLDMQP